MKRLSVFRGLGAASAVVTIAGGYAAVLGAGRFAERRYAERTATSAAAYVAMYATRPPGALVDPAEFLHRARVLATLPDWSPDVEVYLGTAPMVRPTGPTLPLSTLATLTGPRWQDGAAFAPISGGTRAVGVVRVRPHLPDSTTDPWLIGMAAVAALTGVLAALGLRRKRWGWRLGAYVAASLAFGGLAAAATTSTLRSGMGRWLRETGALVEDAGSRRARTPAAALAEMFSPLAADGRLVVDTSSTPVLDRSLAASRPGSPVPIWLGGGRWLSLEPPGSDWLVGLREGVAGTAALAGVVVLVALSWGARDRTRPRSEDAFAAWLFLAPAGAHLAVLTIAPLGLLLYVALHQWDATTGPGKFVGIANLVDMARRADTWVVLGRTGLFALHAPVAVVIALLLALLARGAPTPLVRVLLVAPPLASVAAVGLIWRQGLGAWGWLDQPDTALLALAGIALLLQIGYQVPAFLAALDRIPPGLWDAAAVDGAGPWRRFRRVTEPLLRPVTLSLILIGILVAVQGFTLTFVAGPRAPELLGLHLYRLGWGEGRLDLAAALSVLVAIILGAIALLLVPLWSKGVDDGA